jgi:vacuolar-type H+-ATPase subunit E/Vma4
MLLAKDKQEQQAKSIREQLLENLSAGRKFRGAVLEHGEDAVDQFFSDTEGNWDKKLPSYDK